MINTSVVVTVLNEQDTITSLLSSLRNQSLRSEEIIIVDGGSTDQTINKIQDYKNKYPKFELTLIRESGNISHGRNVGIRASKSEIIALIDAGCVAKKSWLKLITTPFSDESVGLVAGFYTMKASTPWQKAVAPFHGVTMRRFDKRYFMPSARSVAFRKKVWEEVGGFSEQLVRAGEDTLFNYAVVKKGIKIVRCPDAIVEWEVPSRLMETVKKFYYYAKGDAQTGIWWHPAKKFCTHNIKILTIFIRYFVFLSLFLSSFANTFAFYLLIVSFVGYTSWSIWKLHEDVDSFTASLLIPVVQILSDFSVMAGFISGLIQYPQKQV